MTVALGSVLSTAKKPEATKLIVLNDYFALSLRTTLSHLSSPHQVIFNSGSIRSTPAVSSTSSHTSII